MISVLPVLAVGMSGTFLVTGIIIGCIRLLNKFSSKIAH